MMSSLKSSRLFSDNIEFFEEVEDDLKRLDGTELRQVISVINRVAKNPAPSTDGGYGIPLTNNNTAKLAGYNKIKLKKIGLRVVYQYKQEGGCMIVVIIAARTGMGLSENAGGFRRGISREEI